MNRALKAGAAYFATVFALGFVLGTIRVLMLAPLIGEWLATVVELPVMLAASWLLCGWVLRRWQVPSSLADRLVVGVFAFVLLIAAEILLGLTLLGRDTAAQAQAMTRGAGALGLAAQVLFAMFPALRLHRDFKVAADRGSREPRS